MKHGGLQHQHDMIRSHLRLLGRFLCALQSINTHVTDLASVYQPTFYDDALSAFHEIAGFDPNTRKFGSLLKKVARFYLGLYITECIKQEETVNRLKSEDFLKLVIDDIAVFVNKGVTESQTLQKRRKR